MPAQAVALWRERPRLQPLLVVSAAAVVAIPAATVTVGPEVVLAAGLGCVACAVLAIRPDLGAALTAGVLPVLAGLRRGLPLPGLRLSEIMVAATAVIVLAVRSGPRWDSVSRWATAYAGLTLGIGLFDSALHGIAVDADAIGTLVGPVQFVVGARLIAAVAGDAVTRERALRWVLGGAVVASVLALAQMADVGGIRQSIASWTGSDALAADSFASLPRASGPFAIWHSLAGYLVVVIALVVALLATPTQRVASRRGLTAVLAICVAALICTLTLVAWIGTVISVLVIGLMTGRTRAVLIGVVVVVLGGGVMFASSIGNRLEAQFDAPAVAAADLGDSALVPQTIAFRLDVWRAQYLPVVEEFPVLGWGPTLPDSITWDHTESLYLTLLLRGGTVLAVAYIGLVLAVWRLARSVTRRAMGADRAIGIALCAATVAAVVMQLLYPYFTDAGFPHLWWGFAGLLLAIPAERPTARGAEDPVSDVIGVVHP